MAPQIRRVLKDRRRTCELAATKQSIGQIEWTVWEQQILDIFAGPVDPIAVYWFWSPEGVWGDRLCRWLDLDRGDFVRRFPHSTLDRAPPCQAVVLDLNFMVAPEILSYIEEIGFVKSGVTNGGVVPQMVVLSHFPPGEGVVAAIPKYPVVVARI